ncbi:facilitated trehalose transporter Tret1-like [Pectinophora gossypiella]|uniref:facilitated trehalose transporter Tret1-like n=1 Tax=Pectinophora gossypiella TaxID=13191 RepID=UPI00214ECDD4|nr:facilitated trehalose transporter Tret1-like [Pectinophora gossypiella]
MTRTGTVSPFYRQCFVTAAVCGHIIGHGCALGYPAVLLPKLEAPGSSLPITKEMSSWIASAMAIPMLLGNFMSPPIMDRLGRKTAHYTVAVPVLVGWIVIIMATSFEALVIGRILHGLSFGLNLPLRSVLIGEYTSPKNRGAFLTMVSLAQSFGIFFVHLIGSLISWQKTALICILFSFASLIMTIYSPESPSYLAARGKYDDCREVFRWLRGDEEDDELDSMIQARQDIKANGVTRRKGAKEMLVTIKKKEFYKPILLMVHAYAMVEFAGGTTMASYSTVIIGLILGPNANVNFWMIALDGQRIISNTAAVYVINRSKRRVMMFSIGTLSAVTHLVIAGYVYGKAGGMLSYDALWIPVLLINLHIFTVATGMVPLPSVIAGEVFPLEYRSIGGSISIISVATVSFLVLKTFPALIDSLGLSGTYVLYSGMIAYFLIVMWFLLPETKGRTLQEIEDEYKGVRKDNDREVMKPLSDDDKLSKE